MNVGMQVGMNVGVQEGINTGVSAGVKLGVKEYTLIQRLCCIDKTYIFHFFGRVPNAAVGSGGCRLCAIWFPLSLPILLGQATLPGESHFTHPEGLTLILLDKFFHQLQLIFCKPQAARWVLVIDGELVHELAAAIERSLSACHWLLLLGDELHVLDALEGDRHHDQ